MRAYHIYFMVKEPEDFHEINLLANLASCILWKKYYGTIGLYCNQKFLDYLKKYDLDKEYDEINVEVLENIPYKDYLDKYWSFSKIYTVNQIAKKERKFAVIDNDMYTVFPHKINWEKTFVAYHDEAFDPRNEKSTYVSPRIFLDEVNYAQLNWEVNPINCAFMYFNGAEDLLNAWYNWSLGVIQNNYEKPRHPENRDTMFIEQYLLAALIDKVKINWDLILPVTYLHHISLLSLKMIQDLNNLNHGYEWYPLIDSKTEYREIYNKFRHLWGLKKLYHNKVWRDYVLGLIINDLYINDIDFGLLEIKYPKLINSCIEITKDIFSSDEN